MPQPLLIVLHNENSTPGRVGNALRALGHPLDLRKPVAGDPLPDSLEHYAGDKARAAEALGVSVKTVYNHLARYGDDAVA